MKIIMIFACTLIIIICGIIVWPTPPEPICIVCGGAKLSNIGQILVWAGLVFGVAGLFLQLRGNAAR